VKLIELLQRSEGKTLEFKRDLQASPEGALKTLGRIRQHGWGNTLDRRRGLFAERVCGVSDVLKAEERLANLIADSTIHPQLVPDIEVANWRNSSLLVVTGLPQQHAPPSSHQYSGPKPGRLSASGRRIRRAATAQIDELKRLNRMGSFDEDGNAKSEL
jgi:hypothetical protein